jgi:hypothetical protein
MKYRVHRIDVNKDNMQEKIESFLNKLDGEVISVLPHITQYFLCYGAKTNYVIVVEKIR